MKIVWGSIRRAAIAAVVLFGVVGAVQASPVAADGGGNSAAARACQEGHSTLVGVQDGQVTTFDTPGACVAYAAQGGLVVAASVVQPCLNGGYADLATSEDNTTPFSSEAACVRYAAGGGTLVPFVPFIVDPRFEMSRPFLMTLGNSLCMVNVDVKGLAPSTTYRFIFTFSDGHSQTWSKTANAAGEAYLTADVYGFYSSERDEAQTVTVQTYDSTGAVAIGSSSPVYVIDPNCGGQFR
jgi:hypothetical protein